MVHVAGPSRVRIAFIFFIVVGIAGCLVTHVAGVLLALAIRPVPPHAHCVPADLCRVFNTFLVVVIPLLTIGLPALIHLLLFRFALDGFFVRVACLRFPVPLSCRTLVACTDCVGVAGFIGPVVHMAFLLMVAVPGGIRYALFVVPFVHHFGLLAAVPGRVIDALLLRPVEHLALLLVAFDGWVW